MESHRFDEQFDQHGVWRRDAVMRLQQLVDWLRDHELLNDAGIERSQLILQQLRQDKVAVAFVAEFSRGKSELINAVFFAHYGRRIVPASAGRTTMCPSELAYDPEIGPCLRLLPIETRLQPQALQEWRMVPQQWTQIELDVNDPAQLAGAMDKVSETLHVTIERARELGFWFDERPDDNPPLDANGLVEVPRWRHALVNLMHPLLRQGLVVLDTPGLNAIGAEPELTVNLIPQAQAVVFILAADAGVTRSDLAMWREHLAPLEDGSASRFVVLNKIDTLWDVLSTEEQTATQIARQQAETASTLGLLPEQVIAVSAQKGLVGKIRNDAALLEKSRLIELENLLARDVLGRRQSMLGDSVAQTVAHVKSDALGIVAVRRRELDDQLYELRGLRGKNEAVIRQMHRRIDSERQEFDRGSASIQAVRMEHVKMMRDMVELLGSSAIKHELADLSTALHGSGIKFGVRKVYGRSFEQLHAIVERMRVLQGQLHEALDAAFRQLNTEHGFSLQVAPLPDVARFDADLRLVQSSHLQFLGVTNMFQLAHAEFAEKLVRALIARVRSIFETALGEMDLWSKTCMAQLDTELRERRRAYMRRSEAIGRIEYAAGGLDHRIAEINKQSAQLVELEQQLMERCASVMTRSARNAAKTQSAVPA